MAPREPVESSEPSSQQPPPKRRISTRQLTLFAFKWGVANVLSDLFPPNNPAEKSAEHLEEIKKFFQDYFDAAEACAANCKSNLELLASTYAPGDTPHQVLLSPTQQALADQLQASGQSVSNVLIQALQDNGVSSSEGTARIVAHCASHGIFDAMGVVLNSASFSKEFIHGLITTVWDYSNDITRFRTQLTANLNKLMRPAIPRYDEFAPLNQARSTAQNPRSRSPER